MLPIAKTSAAMKLGAGADCVTKFHVIVENLTSHQATRNHLLTTVLAARRKIRLAALQGSHWSMHQVRWHIRLLSKALYGVKNNSLNR